MAPPDRSRTVDGFSAFQDHGGAQRPPVVLSRSPHACGDEASKANSDGRGLRPPLPPDALGEIRGRFSFLAIWGLDNAPALVIMSSMRTLSHRSGNHHRRGRQRHPCEVLKSNAKRNTLAQGQQKGQMMSDQSQPQTPPLALVGVDALVRCPFCHEDGFDLPGLKSHLAVDCEVWANTPTLTRYFFRNAEERKNDAE